MRFHQVLAGDAEGWEIGESGNQERGQGGPVAEDSMLPVQQAQVRSLVRQLDPTCRN